MAWSASGGFRQMFADDYATTVVLNLTLTTHKVALYNNTGTPDFDTAAATSAYNTGAWVTANEITGTGYTATGQALAGTTVTTSAGRIVKWTGTNSSWTTSTFSAVNGCLIYADAMTTPVADQGICGVYFGGAFQVTAGTFTIQWAGTGIIQFTY